MQPIRQDCDEAEDPADAEVVIPSMVALLHGWRLCTQQLADIAQQTNGFDHNSDPEAPPKRPDKKTITFARPVSHPEAIVSALQRTQSKVWEHQAIEIAITSCARVWGDTGRRIATMYCITELGSTTLAKRLDVRKNLCSLVIGHMERSAPAIYEGIKAAKWLSKQAALLE